MVFFRRSGPVGDILPDCGFVQDVYKQIRVALDRLEFNVESFFHICDRVIKAVLRLSHISEHDNFISKSSGSKIIVVIRRVRVGRVHGQEQIRVS